MSKCFLDLGLLFKEKFLQSYGSPKDHAPLNPFTTKGSPFDSKIRVGFGSERVNEKNFIVK